MAVFGNLADFPLIEVLPLVAYREGALKIALEEEGTISEIHIRDRTICGVRKEGHFLEPLEAHQVLRDLLKKNKGLFWFDPEAEPPKENHLSWPVQRLILEFAEEEDSVSLLRQHLPTPQTWFYLTDENSNQELSLSESIFLEKAFPHLERGTTVENLANLLDLSLQYVAFYLHKLQLAGLVEPRRAFTAATSKLVETNVLSRLWRALTRSVL